MRPSVWMMMWRQSGLECRTLSGRLGRVIAKKCTLCSRWWEASGGGSVQQRRRLPLRRRQEASSGEENRLRLFTARVTSVFRYVLVCLTPVFELGTATSFELRKNVLGGRFSATRRQLNCLHINSPTRYVNTGSHTSLLLPLCLLWVALWKPAVLR